MLDVQGLLKNRYAFPAIAAGAVLAAIVASRRASSGAVPNVPTGAGTVANADNAGEIVGGVTSALSGITSAQTEGNKALLQSVMGGLSDVVGSIGAGNKSLLDAINAQSAGTVAAVTTLAQQGQAAADKNYGAVLSGNQALMDFIARYFSQATGGGGEKGKQETGTTVAPVPNPGSGSDIPVAPAPTRRKGNLPSFLVKWLTEGANILGYNNDHSLPADTSQIGIASNGWFSFADGRQLAPWANATYDILTPSGMRKVAVPVALDKSAPNGEWFDGMLAARLSRVAKDGGGYGTPSGDVSNPLVIFIVVRSIIEDAIHEGKDPKTLGTPYWQWFLAGSPVSSASEGQ